MLQLENMKECKIRDRFVLQLVFWTASWMRLEGWTSSRLTLLSLEDVGVRAETALDWILRTKLKSAMHVLSACRTCHRTWFIQILSRHSGKTVKYCEDFFRQHGGRVDYVDTVIHWCLCPSAGQHCPCADCTLCTQVIWHFACLFQLCHSSICGHFPIQHPEGWDFR